MLVLWDRENYETVQVRPNKQQYNNAKPFPVYVIAVEEVEHYNECFKWLLCVVYKTGISS